MSPEIYKTSSLSTRGGMLVDRRPELSEISSFEMKEHGLFIAETAAESLSYFKNIAEDSSSNVLDSTSASVWDTR